MKLARLVEVEHEQPVPLALAFAGNLQRLGWAYWPVAAFVEHVPLQPVELVAFVVGVPDSLAALLAVDAVEGEFVLALRVVSSSLPPPLLVDV